MRTGTSTMPRIVYAKHDLDEETGLHEVSGRTTETRAGESAQQADSNDVLKAITSLQAELARVKSDICNKIETEISRGKAHLEKADSYAENRKRHGNISG